MKELESRISSLLEVREVYKPPKDVVERAWIKNYDEIYERSIKDPEGFWDEVARELEWFRKWDKVLEWKPPYARWFVGGKCNIVHNALDRHVRSFRKNKVAIYWEGEPGDKRVVTYYELYKEVNRFANALMDLGVGKGDRVVIYLPRIPEQIIAMLACAKIGAIHSVVYSGFSSSALRERILDAKAKIVVTADGGYYRGRVIELKSVVDEALEEAPRVQHVVVVDRAGLDVNMQENRDFWWDEIVSGASKECETRVMDSEDPLFILYTSGTTGKPKGVLHVHGGYMVGVYLTAKWVFDLKDEDIYWCTADPGWITGHSYVVYGPLLNGATIVLYEGAPNYPDPGRWWSIIERYGVTIFYTTPTAIRMFMRYGEEWPRRYDLSSLRLLGTVGEPINPDVWKWYYRNIGNERCPIMDTWWQTETGMIMISPLPCVPLKPGSCFKPFPGVIAEVVDEKGNKKKPREGGLLVIRNPWPAMMRTIYGDPERYEEYWNIIQGCYFTGDAAVVDEQGYFYVLGRVDDVIKVSGYRLGTWEIESAIVSHPAVAEAAVIGKPHHIKGDAIKAFVVLREGYEPSSELREEIKEHVRRYLGPIAVPDEIEFVDKLPKTRSGKIMRRVLKARELGIPVEDLFVLGEEE